MPAGSHQNEIPDEGHDEHDAGSTRARSRRAWQPAEAWLLASPLLVLLGAWLAPKLLAPGATAQGLRLARPNAVPWRARTGYTEGSLALAFSRDSRNLASGGMGGVDILDARTDRLPVLSTIHEDGWGGAVVYSPDGRTLALGCGVWIRLRNLKTGASKTLPLHGPGVSLGANSLDFSPRGDLLAVGSGSQGSGAARLWDTRSGTFKRELEQEGSGPTQIQCIAFSRDGRIVVGAAYASSVVDVAQQDCVLRVWDTATGRQKFEVTGRVRDQLPPNDDPFSQGLEPRAALALAPGGGSIAVNWNGVSLLGPRAGRVLATLPHPNTTVCALAFSPDGKWLASGGASTRSDADASHYDVLVWDVRARQVRRRFSMSTKFGGAHRGQVTSVRFSPNGRSLAAGVATKSPNGLVKLWDVSDLK